MYVWIYVLVYVYIYMCAGKCHFIKDRDNLFKDALETQVIVVSLGGDILLALHLVAGIFVRFR